MYHKPSILLRDFLHHWIFTKTPWSSFYYCTKFTAVARMVLLFLLGENLLFLKTNSNPKKKNMVKNTQVQWATVDVLPEPFLTDHMPGPRERPHQCSYLLQCNFFWHFSASTEKNWSNQPWWFEFFANENQAY